MDISRKELLRLALGAAAALALPRRVCAQSPAAFAAARRGEGEQRATLPRRALGRTGAEVTLLGLGGFHLGGVASEREARSLVDAALEEGVRFFDNAESYQDGKAERWMGAALEGRRDEVFLMTKTFSLEERSAESAKRHLEESLERLRTERLDLWQLHSVRSVEDVDRAFREGGAMELILEQQEKGVVRFVGVTGHTDPAANLRALEHHDRGMRFDCMQLPLNPIDAHQKSFQREVLPALVERGIAVLAMKTTAAGALLREGICTIEECLRYAWSLPISVAIVGMESVEQVRENAALARAFRAMEPEEVERLLARIAPRASLDLEWYKR